MLVSIIIPTFNGAAFVGDALGSVCAQSLRDLEILVLDDQSTDGTLNIVAQCHDPRLRVVRNSARLGLAGNWNRGIQLTCGEYVLILHQDDRLAPLMLETQVDRLEQSQDAGYAYSGYRLIDERAEVLQVVKPFPEDHVWTGEQEFRWHLRKSYVQCPTVVVRRTCYETLGLFDTRLVYALDWEMWLRMETHGYFVVYVAEPLADWRLHGKSATWSILGKQHVHIKDEIAALDLAFDKIPAGRGELSLYRRHAFFELIKQSMLRAIHAARHGDWPGTRRHLHAARLVYRHAGDLGFFPFLLLELTRFVGRRLEAGR